MVILKGDIKLLASKVMDDVPEGGGPPTASEIHDGVSNEIFEDISEVDRAAGSVSLRKIFVAVQTATAEKYMDANVIVAVPPADPNVSVTMIYTDDVFDERDSAKSRIESYLTQGPEWAGYLFENHISGQRAIQIFQRPAAALPAIGRTLVLITDEGLPSEYKQYVRVTRASAKSQIFYDEVTHTDFPADVVTAEISDPLRSDFLGTPARRDFSRQASAARLRDTLVADAGTYSGVSKLIAPVALGALSAKVASVYTQLVPSSQTETPLLDYNAAGQSTTVTPSSNGIVSYTTGQEFSRATVLNVGLAIVPGTLSIAASGVTFVDEGGQLMIGSTAVGAVDYARGSVALSGLTGSYSGQKIVTFSAAAAPLRVPNTAQIAVTQETRAYNYSLTLVPTPSPGSVLVSYMSGGRWYDQRDNGAGRLLSLDSAPGAGTVNYATGSVLMTAGALPDVGSAVLFSWTAPVNFINRSGLAVDACAVKLQVANAPIQPGSLIVTWNDGTARTATDNSAGSLTGAATGTVYYADGIIELSPSFLPAAGQQYSVAYSKDDPTAIKTEQFANPTRNPNATVTLSLHAGIRPGTLQLSWPVVLAPGVSPFYIGGGGYEVRDGYANSPAELVAKDNGQGRLLLDSTGADIGSINYATGQLVFMPDNTTTVQVTIRRRGYSGSEWYEVGVDYFQKPVIMQLSGVAVTAKYVAGGTPSAKPPEVFTITGIKCDLTPHFGETIVPGSIFFCVGTKQYFDRLGSVYTDLDVTTGAATTAGSINYSTGEVTLSVWPVGSGNAIALKSLLTALGNQALSSVAFRVPVAPLRTGSFQILATKVEGGLINVSADLNGVISGAGARGTIDYTLGLVSVQFGQMVDAASHATEPWYDAANVVGGQIWQPAFVFADTIKYNAVAYSYLPIDADLLGLDPVRLPQDGRVPIFRVGGFVVLGNEQTISATVSAGQTINCARVRLSRVTVVGSDGIVIESGYTADLEAGTVNFASVAGYHQPIKIKHRVEDMVRVSDVQINGQLAFTRPITHAYTADSYVSSALMLGDRRARVTHLFDQTTWASLWADAPNGNGATGTYNDTLAPIGVTNRGALSERWALVFQSTTSFIFMGEHVGVIGTGTINADCAPINPAAGVPYFSISELGWGSGWSVGNVLRFNTVGALAPVWVVRTVQQGPETVQTDAFTLATRGDVDRP